LCRAKQERAERKKVLALAQARKVDVILVTELTRWGRSARFAARSYRGRDAHY
jgi:DNA invertase Pin-like site-specific DNA recombinase